jgi:hypothetical protein
MLLMESSQNFNFHDEKVQIEILITKRSPNLNADAEKLMKTLKIDEEKKAQV